MELHTGHHYYSILRNERTMDTIIELGNCR